MCGICGFLSPSQLFFDRREILHKMLKSIEYRGPDDLGEYMDEDICLGMRRLSIIDLETGGQPIFSEDRSVLLVCNGEIYNFQELRTNLTKAGHKFGTSSDVEVIVHLYEDYGEELFTKIEGMFGLAIWDKKKKKLLLGRDRIGIKPLFYYFHGDLFAFASEIKCILKIPGISKEMDKKALYDYFSYNYIPAPSSIYRKIRKLLPGHYLVVDNGNIKLEKYWNLNPENIDKSKSDVEWSEEILECLQNSIQSHLVSDVPLGVLLSGGIDSTAITAIMRKLNVPLRAFSIGFEEKSYNELDYAKMVAKRYDCEHYVEIVRPDAVSLVRSFAGYFDEPFADSSALPVFLVSKLASSRVKVALSGEGGDEIFAGYFTYEADILAEKYHKLPSLLRNNIIPWLASRLPVSTAKVSFDYKAKRFVKGANETSLPVRHFLWKVIFDDKEKNELFLPDFFEGKIPQKSENIFIEYFNEHSKGNNPVDPMNSILYVDSKVYLPDDLLVKVDRMSMANSLEVRVPFLDRKLVELAFSIPSRLKIRNGQKKYIFRKALKGIVPQEILNRKKAGFSIPAGKWLRNELKDFAGELLSPENIKNTGILNKEYVKKVLADHQDGKVDNSRQIWGLMMFMLWWNGL